MIKKFGEHINEKHDRNNLSFQIDVNPYDESQFGQSKYRVYLTKNGESFYVGDIRRFESKMEHGKPISYINFDKIEPTNIDNEVRDLDEDEMEIINKELGRDILSPDLMSEPLTWKEKLSENHKHLKTYDKMFEGKSEAIMASTSIDYDDGDQSTYRGMDLTITRLSDMGKEEFRFETGDPSVDFINMYKKIWEWDNVAHIVGSSSMDHFAMDGDDYKYKVLTANWEQLIPSHIETLEEMQEHYKMNKGE